MRTFIAMVLGLALGLGVATFTYFNDAVIRQTMFVGNFLPISIFGLVILFLLAVNPLLRLAGPRWTLTAGQIAVMTAVGLAACAWPGSNFFRVFTGITAMPAHLIKNSPAWQGVEVMSYVPGGSARLGLGHIRDWPGLVTALSEAADRPDTALHAVWTRLSGVGRQVLRDAAGTDRIEPAMQSQLLTAINDVIVRPGDGTSPVLHADPATSGLDLGTMGEALRSQQAAWRSRLEALANAPRGDAKTVKLNELRASHAQLQITAIDERLNRLMLSAAMPGAVLSMPSGDGLLLNGGMADRFSLDTLVTGWDIPTQPLALSELPWGQWWPTLRLWGGLALTLGLAGLCLAMIVHPQWSRRELLAYPIARFIDELAERDPSNWLPNVARNRLFWVAVIAMVLLHAVNGLNAWFPGVPKIEMQLPLQPLSELLPTAKRVSIAYAAFQPPIFLTVVAFAFFLATDVSLSVGIAMYAWLLLGSIVLSQGVEFQNDFDGGGKGAMLRFGGYLATAVMIFYVGRRYYVNVLTSAVGMTRRPETPVYAVWAARLMVLLLAAAAWLCMQAGLDPLMSAIFVGLCMLTFLVISRIVAETGLFFVQTWWLPMAVLTSLFGAEAIGPTTFLVLAVASVMLVGDPRETLMPYLTNGLQMGDRTGQTSPGRLAWPMALMIVLGFVASLLVVFHFSYNRGANLNDQWALNSLPSMPFNRTSALASDLASTGELAESESIRGLFRLSRIKPVSGALPWLALGAGLVFAAAFARLRLPWWPIHPVMFLVWGTYPNGRFYMSFLIGCVIKAAVVKTMGTKGYHAMKPLMVGVIAGELLAGLLWMGIGASYYAWTGQIPKYYNIFPR